MNIPEKVAELQALVARARGDHFRLVWLVGGSSPERTALLRAFAETDGAVFVELGKKLSGSLLVVPIPLRSASVEECFAVCLAETPEEVTCLDHLEILFEPTLRINPVSLIKGASRRAVILAAWPGTSGQGCLLYGLPDHPAHVRIPALDLESIIYLL